ncbi:MAG: acetyl esterase/lipase [Polyangiales bacterium]|jgi:acetyl esterase/lipase
MARQPNTERSGGLLFALYTLVKPPTFEARTPTLEGVRYSDRAVRRRALAPLCDIYLPDSGESHPSVVVIHGGGFVIGHRKMKPVRLVATRLVEAGFAVCAVDYRLLFRGGGIKEQLDDVELAANYWRSHCIEHGCDPEQVSLAGFSAGAALAMLHAGRAARPYHKLVSIYGPSDFSRVEGRQANLLMRMVMGTSDRGVWLEYSPHTLINTPTPMLLIHGEADRMVPVSHAHELHRIRTEAGLPTQIEIVEGMRHGFVNNAELPETDRAIARAIEFLSL